MPDMKSESGDPSESECSSYVSIEKSIRPLLVSMKLCGLYFEPRRASNKVASDENDESASSRIPEVTCRVYSCTTLALLWMNVVRAMVGLFPSDAGLFSRITQCIWYLLCSVNATILVVSCENLNLFRSFYTHWDSLYSCCTTKGMGCGFHCPVRYLRVATVVGWIVFGYNCIAMNVMLYSNFGSAGNFSQDMLRPLPDEIWARTLVTVAIVFNTAAWIFPVIIVLIISKIIREQFLRFETALSRQIEEAGGRIPEHLPELRIRYIRLCQAVGVINKTFKWMLGTSFLLGIILVCFISYYLINSPIDVFVTSTNLFWLLTVIIYVLILAISSSNVHDSAHKLLDTIFMVGTKDATVSQMCQLNLFIAKLTGTSIGFTAIDFFVITKEVMLTMGGLYITYFILLLQFRIG